MIYVASCCVRAQTIKESVETLAKAGIKNIELTGGTRYYPEYENDLLNLKDKFELNYMVHNYFPPPTESFILNLSSLDDDLYATSITHCKRAIDLCKRLGSSKYGVHAGFLIDFSAQEAGKKIRRRALNNRERSLNRFSDAWRVITDYSANEVEIYIENNVLSLANMQTYEGDNPFLMTDYDGYNELRERMDFNILLDFAHLKVSANSLRLNYKEQVEKLLPLTDYIHVSGNDGLNDQNLGLNTDKETMDILTNSPLSDKTVTLEVYDGIESVLNSYSFLSNLK